MLYWLIYIYPNNYVKIRLIILEITSNLINKKSVMTFKRILKLFFLKDWQHSFMFSFSIIAKYLCCHSWQLQIFLSFTVKKLLYTDNVAKLCASLLEISWDVFCNLYIRRIFVRNKFHLWKITYFDYFFILKISSDIFQSIY